MSAETYCYAIAYGEYSDYSIACIFEREEDAQGYLRAQGYEYVPGLRFDPWRKVGGSPWETCRIEDFQFYRAGEVPHAEAIR